MRARTLTMILAFALGGPVKSSAESGAPAATDAGEAIEMISVYLDCQTFDCDFDHFRREISFVTWVRDRGDSHVHVLGTHLETGGGGREHTFVFIGRREFAGQRDTLVYVSRDSDSEVEIRAGLVRTVQLGLVRFAARTPVAERLTIFHDAPAQATAPADDPWNLWVFALSLGGNASAESEQRSFSGHGSLHANRTAEDSKLDFVLSGRASRSETDVPEIDTTFVATQESFSFDALAVRSLGQHWALGVRAFSGSSTFTNTDFTLQGGPALEYNVYPYSESTRRQLTFLYTAGFAHFVYEEETVFGVTTEVRPKHVVAISLMIREPWGAANTSLQASQFLHDAGKHRIDLGGSLSIRLVRGLDLNVFGGASRVKDQLFISGVGLTPEERLLRTRQFETEFLLFGGVGFRLRFGSKFTNIVNPRMGTAGRGFIF